MNFLFAIAGIFLSLPSHGLISKEGIEYFTPEQKSYLEEGIAASEWPSYCPMTAELAKNRVKPPKGAIGKAEVLVVDKSRRLLHLLHNEQIIASYRIALGKSPVGDKVREGDNKTPEGRYFIELKNPKSEYHLGLKINYPNKADIEEALRKGIKDPGKDILFHGLPNSWYKRKFINHPEDWTRGCMAVTDAQIEQIYASVEMGSYVEICP
ncbi:L,D-transpeptidase family protein [Bdellovibrio sp. HCB2-146]|uniref:L,D-transpeptidase family protein n=1 Tax=Bdellovibrio sp. HCB2-146 TaxID=3394362 RepID=UPI0039BD180E